MTAWFATFWGREGGVCGAACGTAGSATPTPSFPHITYISCSGTIVLGIDGLPCGGVAVGRHLSLIPWSLGRGGGVGRVGRLGSMSIQKKFIFWISLVTSLSLENRPTLPVIGFS